MNKRLTFFIILMVNKPLFAAQIELMVVYEKHTDTAVSRQVEHLQQDHALPAMVNFVNEHIALSQPPTLRIGADDGPLFDPSTNEIWIPSEFFG